MAKWIIDPDHTVAAFIVRHFMITDVRGQFNRISGTINYDISDLTSLSVEVAIDASAMTTGIAKRDEHLKSQDFLYVEKFPNITFKSGKVELTGINSCKVHGDLTMRGVTKPAVLDAEFLGPIKSPWGETCIGVSARTEINRVDFGASWHEPMENNGVVAGENVHIILHAEADLKEES